MRYLKMSTYRFSPYFTRVIIASPELAYAEFTGRRIPAGCEEISEADFNVIVSEFSVAEESGNEIEKEVVS
jgi:hypothetical protein